jgi:hypothetical protein
MIAPDSSALMGDGAVGYLWSCGECGEAIVTRYTAEPAGRSQAGLVAAHPD